MLDLSLNGLIWLGILLYQAIILISRFQFEISGTSSLHFQVI